MVSQAELWDPHHSSSVLSELNQQRLADLAPPFDVTLAAANDTEVHAHKSIRAARGSYFRQLSSSLATSTPLGTSSTTTPGKERVVEPS